MKVKEIIEILGVEPEKLINQLDNVGIVNTVPTLYFLNCVNISLKLPS